MDLYLQINILWCFKYNAYPESGPSPSICLVKMPNQNVVYPPLLAWVVLFIRFQLNVCKAGKLLGGYLVERWVRGMCNLDRALFRPLRFTNAPFYLKIGLDIGRIFATFFHNFFNEFFLWFTYRLSKSTYVSQFTFIYLFIYLVS